MNFIVRTWLKAIDAVGRLDHKLTGAYYRPSNLGLLLMILVSIPFLPFIPLTRRAVRQAK